MTTKFKMFARRLRAKILGSNLAQDLAAKVAMRLPEMTVRNTVEALDRRLWAESYVPLTSPDMFSAAPITGLAKESGHIRREIVHFVNELASKKPIAPLFLPGEYKRVTPAYTKWLGIESSQIVTAGLGDDVDVTWNFEDDPPSDLGPFALVVSQAMIEHLIDPYKHICDLYSLVDVGGSMIIHTVVPGFIYHRYPVDCCRFFPDWFEEAADRLGAQVTGRFEGDRRILYQFTKRI